MENETHKTRTHGSGSGEEFVYFVEARNTFEKPQISNDMILDNRWRRVMFAEGHPGVVNKVWSAEAARFGKFLNHQAALALGHWFLANADHFCVEVRLVKVLFKQQWSTEELGVSQPISMLTERESMFGERSEEPEASPCGTKSPG